MKYLVSIYPAARPIIEMGLMDRNKFLNNSYCLTIECNTTSVLKYKIQLWINKNPSLEFYGFYIYNHKDASNYFMANVKQLFDYIDRGELDD